MVKIKKTILVMILVVMGVIFSASSFADLQISDCELDWNAPYGDDDDDGCDGADIPPGSKVEMKIDIENTFDFDIEDAYVEIRIKDIDDEGDDDIEEESDEEDIRDGDEESFKINFEIPLKVDHEDDYDFFVIIKGENESNDDYEYVYNYTLGIDKERDQVIFTKASVFPESISCEGSATVDVEIYNLGENDQDDVEIRIRNDQLGLDERRTGIDLDQDPFDEDASYATTFTVKIEEGTDAGTYPLYLTATYKDGDKTANEQVDLIVEACAAPEPEPTPQPPAEEDNTDDDVVVVTEPTQNEEDTTEPTINIPPEIVVAQNKDDSNLVKLVIALEVIIIIVGIILAIAWLSRRK